MVHLREEPVSVRMRAYGRKDTLERKGRKREGKNN